MERGQLARNGRAGVQKYLFALQTLPAGSRRSGGE
jgi:hypothetical protein